jgi:hypothetical protein
VHEAMLLYTKSVLCKTRGGPHLHSIFELRQSTRRGAVPGNRQSAKDIPSAGLAADPSPWVATITFTPNFFEVIRDSVDEIARRSRRGEWAGLKAEMTDKKNQQSLAKAASIGYNFSETWTLSTGTPRWSTRE